MFTNILKAEKLKLHNSPVWIAFFIIPCLSAFMGTFNYLSNKSILTKAWYSLWTQHTIFYCYFCFPALIGVYCAYECRLEHTRNNWNMVLTMPLKKSYIFFAKFITIFKVVLAAQLLVLMLFYICGKLAGFNEQMPLSFILFVILGSIASLPIIALQLALSLKIKSFSIPIGISMIGGIFSLAFYAKGLGFFFPYSLFALGMCSNDPSTIQFNIIFFIFSAVIFTVLFSFIGIKILGKEN